MIASSPLPVGVRGLALANLGSRLQQTNGAVVQLSQRCCSGIWRIFKILLVPSATVSPMKMRWP